VHRVCGHRASLVQPCTPRVAKVLWHVSFADSATLWRTCRFPFAQVVARAAVRAATDPSVNGVLDVWTLAKEYK
jgi:hypothetical protein